MFYREPGKVEGDRKLLTADNYRELAQKAQNKKDAEAAKFKTEIAAIDIEEFWRTVVEPRLIKKVSNGANSIILVYSDITLIHEGTNVQNPHWRKFVLAIWKRIISHAESLNLYCVLKHDKTLDRSSFLKISFSSKGLDIFSWRYLIAVVLFLVCLVGIIILSMAGALI